MTAEEKTTIELEPDQVALVMSENGSVSLFMPDYVDDEDTVPPYVHYMVGVAALTVKGPELYNHVMEKTQELLEDEDLLDNSDEE